MSSQCELLRVRVARTIVNKSSISIWGSGAALVLLGFLIAYQFVQPAPPGTLVLGTGSEGGAYFAFGERYRDFLDKEGIELVLKPSSGSVDNLDALSAGDVDAAFVQGGVASRPPPKGLAALASLFPEPLWVFLHTEFLPGDAMPTRLDQLRDRRLAIGADGSGTQQVVLDLLTNNGIGPADATLLKIGGEKARDALRAGDVDAAFLVASPQAAIVQDLMDDPRFPLMSFERAPAYLQKYRYLTAVMLAEGAIDLGSNRPPSDVTLLAPVASLVAKSDLHPALVDILLDAAKEVHRTGDLFTPAGRFPANDHLDFPLNEEAQRYLIAGPSFLQRYMPFWGANLLDRMAVLLIPALTLMIPMLRILPPVLDWSTRRRVCRYYSELVEIESQAGHGLTTKEHRDLSTRIETKVRGLQVPTSRMDLIYSLRMHIDLIRDRLNDQQSRTATATASLAPEPQPTPQKALSEGKA